MRYLFLFLPLFSFAQDVVKDTVYIQKQGNIYYIIQQTTLSDSTVTGSKQILGDSATAIQSLVTKFVGDWKLNFNGEIIDGVIELNNNKRLIFNPDNGKVYSISTNLLLSTFTNQVSFAFNGVKYDLYKYADGKFATVDGDVRLIKLE
jgi:hypothetical protein